MLEVLTEWRRSTDPTSPNVVARMIRVDALDSECNVAIDPETHQPIRRLAIEHKVVGPNQDTSVTQVKPYTEHELRARFAHTFAEFEGRTDVRSHGHPIESLDDLPVTVHEKLRSDGITTVEALAAMTDGDMARLGPGARKWRQSARTRMKQITGPVIEA